MKLYHVVPEADIDIVDEYEYLYLQNPAAAERFIEELTHAFRHLGGWPESGRLRPELNEHVRSWTSGKYLIFYNPETKPLQILAIVHGAQDLNRIFQQRYPKD